MALSPRIALIHATPVAVEPIRQVLAADWPEAEAFNILDDSLSSDRAKTGEISEELTARIIGLARYAHSTGADAILFTCSAFGTAITKAADLLDIPVLKPNEAMFEAAIERGRDIAMVVTFPPARASMEVEFAEEAQRVGASARLTSFVAEGAITALKAGDLATHHRLVTERARTLSAFDTIVLAHFSTAPAAPAVRAAVHVPVLTSPEAAVAKLRRLLAA